MTSGSLLFSASIALATLGCATAGCEAARNGGDGSAGGVGGGGGDLGFGGKGSGGGPLQVEPECEGVDPAIDKDGDGWSGAQGDCNDCTPQMNPGAQDYPGNHIDEDCNGEEDDNPVHCDGGLALASPDPMDGARALGLCKVQQGERWGVVSARYITSDGQPLSDRDLEGIGWGLLPAFGPNVKPQEGAKMLVLSSGTARQPTDPGFDRPSGHDKGYSTSAPPGYPKESPACPDVETGEPHDSAGLRVVIKTPTNARSLSFALDFYTYEFPGYICTKWNDFFVAMLTPRPASQADGNISYDGNGNTISVNAGFLQVCHPQKDNHGVPYDCPLGSSQLAGTGFDLDLVGKPFDGSAASGWLKTTSRLDAPGAEITLDFAVWDSGDGFLDSTVLLDDFRFGLDDTATVTEPIPDPE